MFKLHRLSLVHQMAVTAAIASLCVFTVLIGLTSHLTERAALAKTEEELHGQIKNISQLLELSHANAVADASKALRRFKDSLGPIRIGAETLAVGRYQLPIVRGGDRILNDNLELLEGLRRQIDADPAWAPPAAPRRYELMRTVVVRTPAFAFTRPCVGFETFAGGELIATDGADEVRAPEGGCTILMPARVPVPGREGVYLARPLD